MWKTTRVWSITFMQDRGRGSLFDKDEDEDEDEEAHLLPPESDNERGEYVDIFSEGVQVSDEYKVNLKFWKRSLAILREGLGTPKTSPKIWLLIAINFGTQGYQSPILS